MATRHRRPHRGRPHHRHHGGHGGHRRRPGAQRAPGGVKGRRGRPVRRAVRARPPRRPGPSVHRRAGPHSFWGSLRRLTPSPVTGRWAVCSPGPGARPDPGRARPVRAELVPSAVAAGAPDQSGRPAGEDTVVRREGLVVVHPTPDRASSIGHSRNASRSRPAEGRATWPPWSSVSAPCGPSLVLSRSRTGAWW